MTAAELAAKISEHFTCVQGIFAAHCQTGERYQEFALRGGPDDEERLCQEFFANFNFYVHAWIGLKGNGALPTIYWRFAPPHIVFYADDDPQAVKPAVLRTRLALTIAPVVFQDVEAYDVWWTKQLETELLSRGNADGQG